MKRYLVFSTLGLALLLNGCGGSGDSTTTTPSTTPDMATSYSPNDGRLLASGCFQCHGTNGISTNSWDGIAGEDNLKEEMFEEGAGHIMTAQAKGYTDSEITAIQSWLATVSKSESEGDDDD